MNTNLEPVGSTTGGPSGSSGGAGEAERGKRVGAISFLAVYPVKSLMGIEVESWPVAANGLLLDRRWMVVDVNGRQLTQRELPRMCLIEPKLRLRPPSAGDDVEQASTGPAGPSETTETLTLSVPGSPAEGCVEVALDATGPATSVRVWDDQVEAVECGAAVGEWLSDFLQCRARLVRFSGADEVAGRPWQRVAFPDSLPFLLIGQASLDDLNARLQAQGKPAVEMNRFRPNLVVAGSDGFAEDGWRRISIGELEFTVRLPCGRCVITTVEQATSNVGREPLRTLATYRTHKGKVMFGQKLIHDREGVLSVGDAVHLHESVPAGEGMRFDL